MNPSLSSAPDAVPSAHVRILLRPAPLQDLHVHSCFSDGRNTPEEIVQAAIARGLTTLGISDHSDTSFDQSYCMKKTQYSEYCAELLRLRNKYAAQIRLLIGIEQDLFSDASTDPFDYVIGSVHYFHIGKSYIPVDETPQILQQTVDRYFDGDWFGLTDLYYEQEAQVVEKTGADLIGHFDLITKFNEGGKLFDESDPRYRRAWQQAADLLLKTGKPFEINTGAISRGYRTTPYPSAEIRQYLLDRGASLILSSDSHRIDNLLSK